MFRDEYIKRDYRNQISNILVTIGIIISLTIGVFMIVNASELKSYSDGDTTYNNTKVEEAILTTDEVSSTNAASSTKILSKYDVYDIEPETIITGKIDEENSVIIKRSYGATYYDEPKTMWVTESMKLRTTPSEQNTTTKDEEGNEVDNYYDTIPRFSEVTVIGECDSDETKGQSDHDWYIVSMDDQELYMASTYCVNYDPVEATYNHTWDGPTLDYYKGIIQCGPSGLQETFYCLDMSWVVSYMQYLGYDYDYWVRDDGVKMFGQYVMIAADLSRYPKGTIIETSLGTGMVCDTGSFVNWAPNRIDIATNWDPEDE